MTKNSLQQNSTKQYGGLGAFRDGVIGVLVCVFLYWDVVLGVFVLWLW